MIRPRHKEIQVPAPFGKWTRKRFDTPDTEDNPEARAELETDRDLTKSIEQLLCDFHDPVEQALHNPSIPEEAKHTLNAQKRMVAMMARVAISNEKTSNIMKWLTVIMLTLTVLIAILTAAQLYVSYNSVKSANNIEEKKIIAK